MFDSKKAYSSKEWAFYYQPNQQIFRAEKAVL
jgi:hypothetical protein